MDYLREEGLQFCDQELKQCTQTLRQEKGTKEMSEKPAAQNSVADKPVHTGC